MVLISASAEWNIFSMCLFAKTGARPLISTARIHTAFSVSLASCQAELLFLDVHAVGFGVYGNVFMGYELGDKGVEIVLFVYKSIGHIEYNNIFRNCGILCAT